MHGRGVCHGAGVVWVLEVMKPAINRSGAMDAESVSSSQSSDLRCCLPCDVVWGLGRVGGRYPLMRLLWGGFFGVMPEGGGGLRS
ncbi:hypothetical protein HaLaN_25326 [Haematococcus lacustris]|uniref:Uncharacterized protein n=1 Tax=Haematococcus lacustris TaxID=44745 RepID=A0A699ZVX1_HAELA|nr:hypothetical protein HaLaN_25326 [Haematococcus lacustris]